MKNLFFTILIMFTSAINAQVDYDKFFISYQTEFLVKNPDTEDYESTAIESRTSIFIPFQHMLAFKFVESEDYEGTDWRELKWTYMAQAKKGDDVYLDESGGMIIFDYNGGIIEILFDVNEETNKYQQMMRLSKLVSYDKQEDKEKLEEYIPQTQRKK